MYLHKNSYLYTSIARKSGKILLLSRSKHADVTRSFFPLCHKNILNESYVNMNGDTDFEEKRREKYSRSQVFIR